MSVDLHRQAEMLMGDADVHRGQGRLDDARRLYGEAARLEAQVFQGIPTSRLRTRGIIAVSAVALYDKAGELADAIRHAHRYLAEPDLPEFAIEQLNDLLLEAQRKLHSKAAGNVLGPDTLQICLSRGRVGMGIARLDTILVKLDQMENYFWRIVEWLMDKPFRTEGRVTRDVLRLCRPMISQPTAGSFRVGLRLEMPLRLPSPDFGPVLTPEHITSEFLGVLQLVTQGSPKELEKHVSHSQYRQVFVQHVAQLAPDGKEIGQLEISSVGTTRPAKTVLTPASREIARSHMPPTKEPNRNIETVVDVLRGVQLNKGWIVLGEKGNEKLCYIQETKVFEDVLGPLLTRRVRVEGYLKGSKFILRDVQLDTEEDAD